MGHGLTPASPDNLTSDAVADDGTLARTESPTPGPVGMDSGGAGTAQGGSLAERILNFPRRRRGQRVGDGECYTMTDEAMTGAGAKSARDFGKITPDADYVWGTAVTLAELRPGDVIQFRGYRYDREMVTERKDGEAFEEDFKERPHHTAIVDSVEGGGAVMVLEQNAPAGSPIVRNRLFFTSGTTTSGKTRTTIKVKGSFWFYRPQAK